MGDASEAALSPAEVRALACVLDLLVPRSADGRLPGAGELGLVAAIEAALRDAPGLRPAVHLGLAALAERARERGAEGFDALPAAERRAALDAIAAAQPAFVPGLVFHTYVAYYRHDRVLLGLGLEPRPPHPLGYALEPGDFSRLEKVRRRGRLYRD